MNLELLLRSFGIPAEVAAAAFIVYYTCRLARFDGLRAIAVVLTVIYSLAGAAAFVWLLANVTVL